MASNHTSGYSDEYVQGLLEQQIQNQYDLYDWGSGISTASPLDILIMLEDEDEDDEINFLNQSNTFTIKGVIL